MQKLIKNPVSYRVSCALVLAVLFADVFIPVDNLYKLSGIHTVLYVLLYALAVTILRLFYKIDSDRSLFQTLFLYIGPVIAVSAVGLELLERALYANVVYSYIRIIPKEFTIFYLYVVSLLFVHLNISFVKENIKKVLFVLPIYFYPIILLHFYFPSFDAWLKGENRLEEMIQFFLFGACTILSWKLFRTAQKKGLLLRNWKPLIYLFMTVFFFIITFEEISWGQKLFELDIPEYLADLNTQQELNIHNNKNVFPYVYYAYLFISGFGAFGWIFLRLLTIAKRKLTSYDVIQFIPPWYLTFYFLFNFLYVLVRKSLSYEPMNYYINEKILSGVNSIWEWEEHTELLLACGIFLFVYELYKKNKPLSRESD